MGCTIISTEYQDRGSIEHQDGGSILARVHVILNFTPGMRSPTPQLKTTSISKNFVTINYIKCSETTTETIISIVILKTSKKIVVKMKHRQVTAMMSL